MMMNVISIVDSERNTRVLSRLTALGFAVTVIPAVDLRYEELGRLHNSYDITSFERRYGRLPVPGEIGIALSHLMAIRKIAAEGSGGNGVICEDDVIPLCRSDVFERLFEDILASPFDIVVLGYSKCDDNTEAYIDVVNPLLPRFKCESPYVVGVRYEHTTCGAVGYVVKKRAVSVLTTIETPLHLADDWAYFASLGLKIGYLSPMLVREDVLGSQSTVGHDAGYISPRHYGSPVVRALQTIKRKSVGFCRLRILKMKYGPNTDR